MTRTTTTTTATPRRTKKATAGSTEWGWADELPFIRRDLGKDPLNADLHHWLGVCLHELGELIEALFHLQRSDELAPGDAVNLEWLAKCEKSLARSRRS